MCKDFYRCSLIFVCGFFADYSSLSMQPVIVRIEVIRKVANGMIIDDSYINILEEILANNDSFFQDKELALARYLGFLSSWHLWAAIAPKVCFYSSVSKSCGRFFSFLPMFSPSPPSFLLSTFNYERYKLEVTVSDNI